MKDLVERDNSVELAGNQNGSDLSVESNRSIAEVQGAIIVAQKFPRNMNAIYNRTMVACQRKKLAEQSMYAYPKGGQMVSGPSIRLAETLARNFGNLSYGIKEVDQRDGESVMLAYCWDLETNVRSIKEFTVKHERHSKRGVTKLKDPRDIYEVTANIGARRLRNCILSVIPGDLCDEAQDQCEKTLQGNSKEPLSDRIKKMTHAFSEIGVTAEMLEKRLGHPANAMVDVQLIELRKIYQSIRDGIAKREVFFQLPISQTMDKPTSDLNAKLKESMAPKEVEGETVAE